MSRHRFSPLEFSVILATMLSACGAEDSMKGIEPIEADFVLSVFELEASGRGRCDALSSLAGEGSGENGWEVVFPTQDEFLLVLDCRRKGEDMLFEGTGRLLAKSKNRIGWELFSNRTTRGGLEYVISGQGEGEVAVGLRGEERVALVNLETQHQSRTYSIGSALRYEGPWLEGRTLLMYRQVGERAMAPTVCVALELH